MCVCVCVRGSELDVLGYVRGGVGGCVGVCGCVCVSVVVVVVFVVNRYWGIGIG